MQCLVLTKSNGFRRKAEVADGVGEAQGSHPPRRPGFNLDSDDLARAGNAVDGGARAVIEAMLLFMQAAPLVMMM